MTDRSAPLPVRPATALRNLRRLQVTGTIVCGLALAAALAALVGAG